MFDDVKKGDATPSQNLPVNSAPNPMSSPDDMFASADPVVAPEKPSAVSMSKLQVKQSPVRLDAASAGSNAINPILIEDEHSQGAIFKKISVALSGLLLLGLVIWGAYYFFVSKNKTNNDNTNQTNNTNQNQPADNTDNNSGSEDTNNQIEPALDDDGDGLSNAEEVIIGLDPKLPDTDNDGLSDKDELRVHNTSATNTDTDNDGLHDKDEIFTYQTNALDPDTDNDGYLDGVEVQNGYNPNGEGLLVK